MANAFPDSELADAAGNDASVPVTLAPDLDSLLVTVT
jgi:hypothetical protein